LQIEFARNYQEIGTQAPKWQLLSEIIQSAIQQLKPPNIEIRVNTGSVGIFADPLIEKVFYNLMENSLRHGGHVTRIEYLVLEKPDDLSLIICDDGEGITAEDKKNLFQKGFGKHTGLGLFLSKEILSITGIAITENGESGKGVRFEITVPKGTWRKNE
jgi:signal transduction histidine kinase